MHGVAHGSMQALAPTLAVTLTRPSTAVQVAAVRASRSSLDKRRTSDTMP